MEMGWNLLATTLCVGWWKRLEATCLRAREIADSKPELENDDIWRAGRPPQGGSPGFCVLTNALGLVGFWKLRPCLHFNGDNLMRGKLKK